MQRACSVCGRSRVRIPGRPNFTHCCKRFGTTPTSTQVAMSRRWAPQTRYTLRSNTASIMIGLVWTLVRAKTLQFTYLWIRSVNFFVLKSTRFWHVRTRTSFVIWLSRLIWSISNDVTPPRRANEVIHLSISKISPFKCSFVIPEFFVAQQKNESSIR